LDDKKLLSNVRSLYINNEQDSSILLNPELLSFNNKMNEKLKMFNVKVYCGFVVLIWRKVDRPLPLSPKPVNEKL
jgi:hypothetical protein